MAAQADITEAGAFNGVHQTQIRVLFAVAIVLTLAQWVAFCLHGCIVCQSFYLPPLELILDTTFNFIKEDLGLIYATRFLTEGLQWVLDVTANLLFGKRRWPNIGPVPVDGNCCCCRGSLDITWAVGALRSWRLVRLSGPL